MKKTHSHYGPTNTHVPITVTGMEYFGPEQNAEDIETIVRNEDNSLHILGRFQGLWDGELDEAITTATKVTYADHYELKDYLYEVQNLDSYPTLQRMPKVLGFVKHKYHAQIQMQRPGIYCDFPNTWHYTANCSWHSRPLLQISGVASDTLLNAVKNKEYKIFKV